jgi:hypothetical protein
VQAQRDRLGSCAICLEVNLIAGSAGWTDEDERNLHCNGKGGVTMFVLTSDPTLRAHRTYVVIVPPGEIAIPVPDA